jgi:hypothetical protein
VEFHGHQRSWVRFPALPNVLHSSGSGTGFACGLKATEFFFIEGHVPTNTYLVKSERTIAPEMNQLSPNSRRYISSIVNLGMMEMSVQTVPLGKQQYSVYTRLGGPADGLDVTEKPLVRTGNRTCT